MNYRQLGKQAQLVIDVIKVNTDKDIQVSVSFCIVYMYVRGKEKIFANFTTCSQFCHANFWSSVMIA